MQNPCVILHFIAWVGVGRGVHLGRDCRPGLGSMAGGNGQEGVSAGWEVRAWPLEGRVASVHPPWDFSWRGLTAVEVSALPPHGPLLRPHSLGRGTADRCSRP